MGLRFSSLTDVCCALLLQRSFFHQLNRRSHAHWFMVVQNRKPLNADKHCSTIGGAIALCGLALASASN